MEKYFNFNDITDTEDLEELRIKLSNENYANAIINDFLNRKEIIVYNQAFNTKAPDYKKDVDRSRKYFYDEKGRLQKKDITDEEEDFNMLLKRLSRSRRRALDNFLGYAYCNNFKYFITTTFDKTKVDRDNPKAVKYATKLFKEKLSYHFKDIAIVGDQIYTDIIGANIKRVRTIYVKPIELETTFFFKLKRALEKPFLRKLNF